MPTKQVLLLSLFCKTLFTVSEILGAEMRPASMTQDSCQMHFLLNLPDKEPATPLLPCLRVRKAEWLRGWALGPGGLQARLALPLPSCLTLDKLLDLRASLQRGDKKLVKKIK